MCKRNKMVIRVTRNCELCPLFCSMSRLKTLGRTLEILSEHSSPTCWFWTSNQCKRQRTGLKITLEHWQDPFLQIQLCYTSSPPLPWVTGSWHTDCEHFFSFAQWSESTIGMLQALSNLPLNTPRDGESTTFSRVQVEGWNHCAVLT